MDANINPRNVNAACRHPERYSARSPKSAEDQVITLLAAIVEAVQPDFVLETGTHHAHASVALAAALQRNGRGHLDTVERDARLASRAAGVLANYPATVHVADANTWTPPTGRTYGVAFFDTDDKLQLADQFHRMWQLGHIPQFATVAFHDTGTAWPTRATLAPLEADGILGLWDVPTPRGVTIGGVKRGANVRHDEARPQRPH